MVVGTLVVTLVLLVAVVGDVAAEVVAVVYVDLRHGARRGDGCGCHVVHGSSDDHGFLRRMADRLDAVSVGIDDKGCVVVGVVLCAYGRSSVVVTARDERRAVKGTNGGAVGGAEAHVHPPQRRHPSFDSNGELHAKLTGH